MNDKEIDNTPQPTQTQEEKKDATKGHDYQNMQFTLGSRCCRGLCQRGVSRSTLQLNVFDWLADVPDNDKSTDLVEVQFKNTRKGYFHNVNKLDLKKGDWVAVESNPGHDIGIMTMTGRLVALQV